MVDRDESGYTCMEEKKQEKRKRKKRIDERKEK